PGRTGLGPVRPEVEEARGQEGRVGQLGNYRLGEVRLIKNDVQGHEQSVIRGAERTIAANHRPSLLIEVEQQRLDRPIGEVFAQLTGLGYEGWFLRGGQLWATHEFRVERDQPPDGGGVHN